jgi:hypothetical protein
MKKILLIDREFGAGGSTIAARVSGRLGWTLLDQKLTREIARLANIPPEDCRRREERVDPWLQRLVNVVWRAGCERNAPMFNTAVGDDATVEAILHLLNATHEGEEARQS